MFIAFQLFEKELRLLIYNEFIRWKQQLNVEEVYFYYYLLSC